MYSSPFPVFPQSFLCFPAFVLPVFMRYPVCLIIQNANRTRVRFIHDFSTFFPRFIWIIHYIFYFINCFYTLYPWFFHSVSTGFPHKIDCRPISSSSPVCRTRNIENFHSAIPSFCEIPFPSSPYGILYSHLTNNIFMVIHDFSTWNAGLSTSYSHFAKYMRFFVDNFLSFLFRRHLQPILILRNQKPVWSFLLQFHLPG